MHLLSPTGTLPHWRLEWRSYYYAGSNRVAMRVRTGVETRMYYLHADHLSSTSLTTDESGVVVSELRYKAWGEVRYASGATPTDYKYTGQLETDIGIYYYVARFFDPTIARFLSPDSIVPTSVQGIQAWDRYAYVNNSPIRYVDPTGHCIFTAYGQCIVEDNGEATSQTKVNNGNGNSHGSNDEDTRSDTSTQIIDNSEEYGLCVLNYCSGGREYADWWKKQYIPTQLFFLENDYLP